MVEAMNEAAAPNGSEAAAILLMLLAEEEAAQVLSLLQPEEVQHLGGAMFGVAKPLLKRRAAAAAEAPPRPSQKSAIGNEIAAVIAQEARADPNRMVTLDMIEAAPGYSDRAALIRNFVRQDPARAALVVRDLIRADMPGGEEA